MIKHLRITNFRQFKDLKIDFTKDIVIIHGDNTKGKSTILESIYLLTNGSTPWGDFEDEFRTEQEDNQNFRIEGTWEDDNKYSYFRELQKRQLKINGSNTISKKFFEKISSIMFSPEQIDILMISSSKRRDFLDTIISKIDFEYADTLSKYNKTLKQRNAYLKKLSKAFYENGQFNTNDPQLIYWTTQISKYTAIIMAKREETLRLLNTQQIEIVYKPSVTLNLWEDIAEVSIIEKITNERLLESTKRDIATGITNIGAHRDDWVILQGKDVRRFGSRGEKRVAIGRLIFQALELISKNKETRPILLLDDISSELDKENTKRALNQTILTKQQTFITAIELEHIPKEIRDIAQLIDLNDINLG